MLAEKLIEVLKVSSDKGLSWCEKEVDIKQLDFKRANVKVGDWIQRDGVKYEIKIMQGGNFKGLLYASPIAEYVVANRGFSSYEEAVSYCNQCDLDVELNLIAL